MHACTRAHVCSVGLSVNFDLDGIKTSQKPWARGSHATCIKQHTSASAARSHLKLAPDVKTKNRQHQGESQVGDQEEERLKKRAHLGPSA